MTVRRCSEPHPLRVGEEYRYFPTEKKEKKIIYGKTLSDKKRYPIDRIQLLEFGVIFYYHLHSR